MSLSIADILIYPIILILSKDWYKARRMKAKSMALSILIVINEWAFIKSENFFPRLYSTSNSEVFSLS